MLCARLNCEVIKIVFAFQKRKHNLNANVLWQNWWVRLDEVTQNDGDHHQNFVHTSRIYEHEMTHEYVISLQTRLQKKCEWPHSHSLLPHQRKQTYITNTETNSHRQWELNECRCLAYLLYCVVRFFWWHIQEALLSLAKFSGLFIEFLFMLFHTANTILAEILQRHHNLIVRLGQLTNQTTKKKDSAKLTID